MKQYALLFACLFFLCVGSKAQEQPTRWTLRACLDYALEHNIQVKKSKVSHLSGIEDTKQAKAQLFPSLSASVTQGFVNYPSSDAATNNSYSGNYALNAKWTLFDGGQRVQAIKQQEIQNTVDELGIEQNEDDIQISLIQTYMQVLYAMESVRINQNTVEVSTAQRDRAVELLRAGSISKVDLAQLESQLSTDKYQLVVAQTNLDNYKLQLKQLLELDITEEIELVMPELTEKDILTPLPSKQTIYNTSLAVMPQIKSSELAVDIAEMDKINLQAELRSAEAQLASSKTEFEYQQKNYARSKVLHEKQLISDTDYETATYNYEKARAAYDQSQASMVKVNRNLEYATITSPIDGVVINRAVEEGQTVAAGFETPTLFTIAADLTKMQVIADVDEADIGNVEEGQRVSFTVDAYPNDQFEGVVRQIRLGDSESTSSASSSTSSSTVVTYEVVITADNPDLKLKPRLTANITIYTLERANILTLPNKALRFIPEPAIMESLGMTVTDPNAEVQPGKRLVWSRQGNTLSPRQITVGTSNNSVTEVTEGLSEGDEVAVDLASAANMPEVGAGAERSPFMPGPPGSNKNKR